MYRHSRLLDWDSESASEKMNMLPATSDGSRILRLLAGKDDNFWSAERIKHLTQYPNWSIATDTITATRSYTLGASIAASLLSRSLEFSTDLTQDELDRIHCIASTFLLDMLDKADRWEEFLAWFWFLRYNTNSYLRYDLHILSHTGNDIDEFVDDQGDEYTWVHNMYIYDRRRKVIERKLERKRKGRASKSDLHHNQESLSEMDIQCRIMNVLSYYNAKMQAEAFWQSFWQK